MTQGLSNLEIVKIKTAFPLMLDEMGRGQKYRLDRIILDLESMKSIVTFNPFSGLLDGCIYEINLNTATQLIV